MKVEALTLEKAKKLIREQEEMKLISEEEKRTEVACTNSALPKVYEAEIIESLSLLVELPEDRGCFDNWLQRRGIESNTKLYKAFNDKIDQIYRARKLFLDILKQEDALEEIHRNRELSKIDHIIALKERRIHLDFLNIIETSKQELILAMISRMIEEHKAETRLQIAKANARARDYEDS